MVYLSEFLHSSYIPIAARTIRERGFPLHTKNGKGAKYCLVFEGRHYLPRAVARWMLCIQTEDTTRRLPSDIRDRNIHEWLSECGYEVIRCTFKSNRISSSCDGRAWNPEDYHYDGDSSDDDIFIDDLNDDGIDINAPYSPLSDGSFPDYGTGEIIILDCFPHAWKGRTNVIPGGRPGRCHRTLVVAIGFDDSIRERLLEAIEHVSVNCRLTNREVVFLAMRWDPKEWRLRRKSFQKLGTTCVLRLPFKAALTLT